MEDKGVLEQLKQEIAKLREYESIGSIEEVRNAVKKYRGEGLLSKERLTATYTDGTVYVPNYVYKKYGSKAEKAIVERLSEYEELEEKGLLLEIPCKVGEKVYQVLNIGTIAETQADAFYLALATLENRWGKTVFLDFEEAKKALEKKE